MNYVDYGGATYVSESGSVRPASVPLYLHHQFCSHITTSASSKQFAYRSQKKLSVWGKARTDSIMLFRGPHTSLLAA